MGVLTRGEGREGEGREKEGGREREMKIYMIICLLEQNLRSQILSLATVPAMFFSGKVIYSVQ